MRGFDGLEALEGSSGELWNEISGEVLTGEYGAGEVHGTMVSEGVFDEVQEMELASALLEVSSEGEMDRFLGDLFKRVGRAVGSAVRSPTGQALGGILKDAARQALPVLGSGIGSAIGGPRGGQIGSQLATTAGQIFGLELEGLSQEDQEYETARRYVRFSSAAAANAARMPSTVNPMTAARSAVSMAARRHAPGFFRRRGRAPIFAGGAAGFVDDSQPSQGRWVRRGRHVIIVNCNAPQTVETPQGVATPPTVETP